MALLEQAELDELPAWISQKLSHTLYACSSLTQLNGGSANFVYRGILTQPLQIQDGATSTTASSVIVKHFKEFLLLNRDFQIDISRCVSEAEMLNALNNFSPIVTAEQTLVKAPLLYQFDREAYIQVVEDLSNTIDLKAILVSPAADEILTQTVATSIGYNLGLWLQSFYRWASAPAQADLRAKISGNGAMRKLKRQVTYDSFIRVMENFPDILEGSRGTVEDVRTMAAREFEHMDDGGGGGREDWGIIHGDFWSGNVLLPDTRSQETQGAQGTDGTDLFVIDWELAQFGHRAYDIGQLLGDLLERKHFNGVDSALWVLHGFTRGYGVFSDDLAFRTAIHAGVHLICWCTRGAPKDTPERVNGVIQLGRDFIVKGWERDRKWFEGSLLAPMFSGEQVKSDDG